MLKFKDLQTDEYSRQTTIKGLYRQLLGSYCECNQGHDVIDEKDGKPKCRNCYKLNHLDKITPLEMIQEIYMNDYAVEEIVEEDKDTTEIIKSEQENHKFIKYSSVKKKRPRFNISKELSKKYSAADYFFVAMLIQIVMFALLVLVLVKIESWI